MINQPNLVVYFSNVLHVGDIHAIGKPDIEMPVVLYQAGGFGPHDYSDTIVDGGRCDI